MKSRGRCPAIPFGFLVAILVLLAAACAPSAAPPAQPTPAQPAPKPAVAPTVAPSPPPAPKPAAPAPAPTVASKPTTAPAPAPTVASKPTTAPAPATPASKISVNLRLGFTASGQHAPLYLTLVKGYYADEGLDVQINEGTGSSVVVQSVAAGRDTFGYIDRGTMALSVAQGTPVKAIAGILQTSPITIASLSKANIKKPKDLEGKSLALPPSGSNAVMSRAFLKANNVDESKIKMVTGSAQQLPVLVQSGSVDAVTAYLVDLYLDLRKKVDMAEPMLIADHGVNPVAEGLVTSLDVIKNRPDVVRRFVRATLRGYTYARDHLDEAAEALVKQLPDRDKATVREQVAQTMKLTESSVTKQYGLGYQAEAQWKQTQEILAQYADLKKTSADLSVYFTNEYLK